MSNSKNDLTRITLRMPRGQKTRITQLINEGKYFSINEFIRMAIKEKIVKEDD